MVRYGATLCLCCMLLWISMACAPQHNEPAVVSEHGYRVSLHVPYPLLWLGPVGPNFPQAAEVVVRVRDAQGQPVDGIPVMFTAEPSWTQNVTFTPAEALTLNGAVRTIFEANTTGVVHITARVDNVTRTAKITIQSRPSPTNAGS